jgi:hypothetical protein
MIMGYGCSGAKTRRPEHFKQLRTNCRVAQEWVAQNKCKAGRSANGNFAFDGRTLYSYSEPIALLTQVRDLNDRPVALVTSETFSVTTSGKHLNAIWGRLHENRVTVFRVPCIGEDQHSKEENLHHLLTEYDAVVRKYSNCSLSRVGFYYWDHEGYIRLDAVEDHGQQVTGYVTRKQPSGHYKTLDVYHYIQFEGRRVEEKIRPRLLEMHRTIVNFAWAMRMPIPPKDVENDIAGIMALRKERERLFWHPTKVKSRNLRHARKLLLNVVNA